MVKIRLRRQGAKKHPFYRLIVADSAAGRDGRFIAEIGYYDPTRDPIALRVDEDVALHWLRQGAQPSETARALLSRVGVMARLRGQTPAQPAPAEARPRRGHAPA